jgi:hypothetical protein
MWRAVTPRRAAARDARRTHTGVQALQRGGQDSGRGACVCTSRAGTTALCEVCNKRCSAGTSHHITPRRGTFAHTCTMKPAVLHVVTSMSIST